MKLRARNNISICYDLIGQVTGIHCHVRNSFIEISMIFCANWKLFVENFNPKMVPLHKTNTLAESEIQITNLEI